MLGIRGLLGAVADTMTCPLRPDDYWAIINPLWSRRELSGRVAKIIPETSDTSTVVVRPGRGWRGGLAGQHVSVGVSIECVWHRRTFSLSSPPGRPDGLIALTVKARPDGLVSRHIVHGLRPGQILRLGHPSGRFVLPDAPPARLLFVTAGSGITPVMSMLRHLAEGGAMPDVFLAHSARNASEVIFGAELRRMAARFPTMSLYEHHTRPTDGRPVARLTMAGLSAICTDLPERLAWVCGPRGMIDDAESYWRESGIGDRLVTERFHPVTFPGGQGGRVRFARSSRETTVSGDTSLLIAGEDAGVIMPSGCRMGVCHSCLAPLVRGQVRNLRTGEEHGIPGDLIPTCVSAPARDVDIDL
ncbi:ferredoxin reductase [Parafrankia sp. EUN1f]|uniref:ferredoxin reductase n=1 Tax=Parafrankia sp. EUN1f TaxID=102897 RepID=UPI0001C43D71|nr:ferredoxin reductase [Parafrankia sp. EUN1f]EFC86125.1 ferredoxin [Parafrankia sp. EUN1f]